MERETIAVLGATGRVGSRLVKELAERGRSVCAVGRSGKTDPDFPKNAEFRIADIFDAESLKESFRGCASAFLMTPENPASRDVLGDAEIMMDNFREAIAHAGVKKIVGLSSMGAHHESGTGNMVVSHMLENSFEDMPVKQTFIRPAFYYSNWLGYFDMAREGGILPTFFPVSLKIPMIAPDDVARFAAEVFMEGREEKRAVEIMGPSRHSPQDVADCFGRILQKKILAQDIPREQWKEIMAQAGFSDDASDKMILMVQAVIDGKAIPESREDEVVKLPLSMEDYFVRALGRP